MPRPNKEMREEAARGLAWRQEYGRGGTEVGVARARDIVNNKNLSIETVKRMKSYFARHEVDKQGEGWSPGEKVIPALGALPGLSGAEIQVGPGLIKSYSKRKTQKCQNAKIDARTRSRFALRTTAR